MSREELAAAALVRLPGLRGRKSTIHLAPEVHQRPLRKAYAPHYGVRPLRWAIADKQREGAALGDDAAHTLGVRAEVSELLSEVRRRGQAEGIHPRLTLASERARCDQHDSRAIADAIGGAESICRGQDSRSERVFRERPGWHKDCNPESPTGTTRRKGGAHGRDQVAGRRSRGRPGVRAFP